MCFLPSSSSQLLPSSVSFPLPSHVCLFLTRLRRFVPHFIPCFLPSPLCPVSPVFYGCATYVLTLSSRLRRVWHQTDFGSLVMTLINIHLPASDCFTALNRLTPRYCICFAAGLMTVMGLGGKGIMLLFTSRCCVGFGVCQIWKVAVKRITTCYDVLTGQAVAMGFFMVTRQIDPSLWPVA
jgi:hypothetical protein